MDVQSSSSVLSQGIINVKSPETAGEQENIVTETPVAGITPDKVKSCRPETGNISYDAFFVDAKEDVEKLLDHLRASQPDSFLSVIHSPEDFEHDGLVSQIRVLPSGKISQYQGRLLEPDDSQPVILLIDFRKFSPSRLGEVNELFDIPPRIQGKELVGNITIISLLSESMLPDDKSTTGKPMGDFWRRVHQPENRWQLDSTVIAEGKTITEYLSQTVPPLTNPPDGDSTLVINLKGKNWRTGLFGSPDLDDQGSPVFRQGKLLIPGHVRHVVLKGAPWDDDQFTNSIWSVLNSGKFEANGQMITLPDNLRFSREEFTAEDVKTLTDAFCWTQQIPENARIATMNSDSFHACMQEAVIARNGKLCQFDALKEWVSEMDGLRITSPLTVEQWINLLTRLKTFGKPSFTLYVDDPENQPAQFCGSRLTGNNFHRNNNVVVMRHPAPPVFDQLTTDSESRESYDFVVTPDTNLNKLAWHLGISSLEQNTFARTEKEFIHALRVGRSIRIQGLESNPELASQLESLFMSPPALCIQGHKEEFPLCKVTVFWDQAVTSRSPVWQAAIDTGELFQDSRLGKQASDELGQNSEIICSVLNYFVGRFEQLPEDQKKVVTPPTTSKELLLQIHQQLLLEKKEYPDAEGNELIRKAFNSTLFKQYRATPEIYSFLKVQLTRLLPDSENWVDREALMQWLSNTAPVDKEAVVRHYWQLMRHMNPKITQPPLEFIRKDVLSSDESLNKTMALLVYYAPEERQAELKFSLDISDDVLAEYEPEFSRFTQRSYQLEKRVADLLHTLNPECLRRQCLFQKARTIASGICSIAGQATRDRTTDKSESSEAISKLLAQELDPDYLPDNIASITESLLQTDNPAVWHYREERRIKRLAAKVRKHPVTFIQGEAGTGKSYIAKEIAHRLDPEQPPICLTISPLTTIDDLFGRDVLTPVPDSNDLHTVFQPGPVLKWAEQPARSPTVLILDEANLARPELWNCLKGMFEPSPCLYFHGKRIPVSGHHRIIMTGNPDHFSGRKTNPFLKKRVPQLYYRPFDASFLAARVVYPELEKQFTAVPGKENRQSLISETLAATMALYKAFHKLLPEHEFTPRDLTDFNARLARYLSHHSPGQITRCGVNRLVWQAMEDTLTGELNPAFAWRKPALKTWYENRFPCNDSLLHTHRSEFDHFYNRWLVSVRQDQDDRASGEPDETRSRPQLDLGNQSAKSLLNNLWLDLERASDEKKSGQQHSGRHATLVRGPAGRGKDVLIDHLISEWNRSSQQPLTVRRLNAGPRNWDEIQKAIQTAREKGEILVISELNLIKTEYLEGAMNDLLTGSAAPGFHLFVTINPPVYTGRHPISKALQSRFRTLNISGYTPADLEQIANTLIKNGEQAAKVAHWHCQLQTILQQRNLPLSPTAGDISKLATRLNQIQPPPSDEALQELFTKHYFLYLKCAQISMSELMTSESAASQQPEEEALLSELTLRLNQEYSCQLQEPFSILGGISNHYNPSEGTMTLKDSSNRTETELMRDAVRLLAENLWVKQGLPVQSPDDHNILFCACYKRWQQTFVTNHFPQFPDPAGLFPMTREEADTLAIPENQAIIQRLDTLFHSRPDAQQLFTFRDSLYRESVSSVAPESVPEASSAKTSTASKTSETPRDPTALTNSLTETDTFCPPPVITRRVDSETKPEKVTRNSTEIFFRTPTELYRINILTLNYTPDGQLVSQSVAWGKTGFEKVYPATLGASVVLANNQDYGCLDSRPATDWQLLPGLWPHARLLSVKTRPETELEWRRDIYTGRFLFRTKENFRTKEKKHSPVKLEYVIEKQEVNTLSGWAGRPPHCPEPIKQSLEQLFRENPSLQRQLQGKNQAETKSNLIRFCRAFKADKNLENNDGDLELLCQIISEQQGACRHRSEAFQALAMYFGFHVQQVASIEHRWIEISSDSGRSWESVDLGGADHPESGKNVKKAEFSPTQKGVKIHQEVLKQWKGKSKEELASLAKTLGITAEKLEAFIQTPEGSALSLGDQVDSDQTTGDLLLTSQNSEGFSAGFAMYLEEVPFNLEKYTNIICFYLSQHLTLNGTLNPEVLCNLLTEAHQKCRSRQVAQWQMKMEGLAKLLIQRHRISKTAIERRMFENLLSFICLDHDWPKRSDKACINALKILVHTDKFGEAARKRLQAAHQRLNIPLPITTVPEKCKSTALARVFARGKSGMLETRLSGSDIKTLYSWDTEGVLVPDRWVKRLPPFGRSHVERSFQPPVILMAPKKIKSPEWVYYSVINKDTGEIFNINREQLLLDLVRSTLENSPFSYNQQKVAAYAPVLVSRLNQPYYKSSNVKKDMKQDGCTDKQIEMFLDTVFWPKKFNHLPIETAIPAGYSPLKEVLYSQFLEYLCKKAHIDEGKLKIYNSGSTYAPSGWAQPETAEELEAFITSHLEENKWSVDPQMLKHSVCSESAIVISKRDFNLYFQEYITSLGLPSEPDKQ